MTKITSLLTHTSKEIEYHIEQLGFLHERYKVTQESYDYHHKQFMIDPTEKNELSTLKAFEFMTHDLNNIKLHQRRILEERLRVADMLLGENGIKIPEGMMSVSE